MTPWSFIGLFCAAAALLLGSAAAGGFFTLWVMHVTRTGADPLPPMPSISLFGRGKKDDEDEPVTRDNGRRVGP